MAKRLRRQTWGCSMCVHSSSCRGRSWQSCRFCSCPQWRSLWGPVSAWKPGREGEPLCGPAPGCTPSEPGGTCWSLPLPCLWRKQIYWSTHTRIEHFFAYHGFSQHSTNGNISNNSFNHYDINRLKTRLTGLPVGARGVCSPLIARQVNERELAMEFIRLVALLFYSIQVSQNYLEKTIIKDWLDKLLNTKNKELAINPQTTQPWRKGQEWSDVPGRQHGSVMTGCWRWFGQMCALGSQDWWGGARRPHSRTPSPATQPPAPHSSRPPAPEALSCCWADQKPDAEK